VAVHFGRLNQAHDGGGTAAGAQRAREQPVVTADSKLAFILPISGRKLKSIIVGILCMVAALKFETSSNAAAAASCISKPALA